MRCQRTGHEKHKKKHKPDRTRTKKKKLQKNNAKQTKVVSSGVGVLFEICFWGGGRVKNFFGPCDARIRGDTDANQNPTMDQKQNTRDPRTFTLHSCLQKIARTGRSPATILGKPRGPNSAVACYIALSGLQEEGVDDNRWRLHKRPHRVILAADAMVGGFPRHQNARDTMLSDSGSTRSACSFLPVK